MLGVPITEAAAVITRLWMQYLRTRSSEDLFTILSYTAHVEERVVGVTNEDFPDQEEEDENARLHVGSLRKLLAGYVSLNRTLTADEETDIDMEIEDLRVDAGMGPRDPANYEASSRAKDREFLEGLKQAGAQTIEEKKRALGPAVCSASGCMKPTLAFVIGRGTLCFEHCFEGCLG